MGELLQKNNPNSKQEQYVKEKATKLQGMILALDDRKNQVRNYVNKMEVVKMKQDKYTVTLDYDIKIELKAELDILYKEISDLKK